MGIMNEIIDKSIKEIKRIELENVDNDIREVFINLAGGKYPLGLPIQIQLSRDLNKVYKKLLWLHPF
jgi:hypothetical protein